MLIKTHLAIAVLAILFFVSRVENQIVFVVVTMIATLVPDIDSSFSSIGKLKALRILRLFIRHRGLIHSFTFLFLIIIFFVLFFPVVAFPLFLGYGLHLLSDCFTIDGIRPFYPLKKRVSGNIRVGSKLETIIFVALFLTDLFIFSSKFLKVF